jgi:type 1 fimbriae regulatory protein FimB/type 1 fimbriae regulatory protein FimE
MAGAIDNEETSLAIGITLGKKACGFVLANRGHDARALQAYPRHENIKHTVRYTEPAPDRFKDFWQ